MAEVADINKKYANDKRMPIKPKKITAAPTFEVDEDAFRSKNALFSDAGAEEIPLSSFSKHTQHKSVDGPTSSNQFARTQPPVKKPASNVANNQKNSMFTTRGEGQYSESSDDDDEIVR